MRKMPEKIVLIGHSRRHLADVLSEMGVPAVTVERRGLVVLSGTGHEDTERLRGLGERQWTIAPGLEIAPNVSSFLRATLRTEPTDFYRLLACHFAWRIWHDC